MRDAAWFDRLYAGHVDAIYRYFARRAAHDDAPDLTAEVFTVAWRRREDVPDGEMELAWLYHTARNLLANHRRKMSAIPVGDVPEQVSQEGPELTVIGHERARDALAALSARDREIVTLAAWEGMNGAELSVVLGLTRGGADAALSRARARLAEAWEAEDAGGLGQAGGARNRPAGTQSLKRRGHSARRDQAVEER